MTSRRPPHDPLDLSAWTGAQILAECGAAHRRYERRLSEHYRHYFRDHLELGGVHPLLAKDLQSALPSGWGHLGGLIPPRELHRWHLSGKSSQTLGIGLLGAARERDPSGEWLFDTLRPVLKPPPRSRTPAIKFELPMDPILLNERPRQTAVDLLVSTDEAVICTELKWSEAGLGACSCRNGGGDPAVADCASRVLQRRAYWSAAIEVLGLPRRRKGRLCPISWTYQAVRNIAAARALAGDRVPVFALIYDERNPFFGGCGDWPGWARVLDQTVNAYSDSGVRFASATWQDLAPAIVALPGMDAVRTWAREKHQLPV